MKTFKQHIFERLYVSSDKNDFPTIGEMWDFIWSKNHSETKTFYTDFTIQYCPESDLYGKLIRMTTNASKGSFALYMRNNNENTTIYLNDPDKFVEMFGAETLQDIYNFYKNK